MRKVRAGLGDPRATARAHRKDAQAVRAIARAERARAATLRTVAKAYLAEADAGRSPWPVAALRQHARNSESLAEILELEAKTHGRTATRVDADAQLAELRAARPPRRSR
jgi:hypothetical protein